MSVEALAIVLHHSRASGTAKLVLIGIANHDGDGGAWPTIDTLARYANVHRRKVQDALATLERLGEVRRIVQAGGDHNIADHRRPNRYQILLICPSSCDRSRHHRTTRELVFDDLSTGVPNTAPGADSGRGGGAEYGTQTIPVNPSTKTDREVLDPAAREVLMRATCVQSDWRHKFVGGVCINGCGVYQDGRVEDPNTGQVLLEATS